MLLSPQEKLIANVINGEQARWPVSESPDFAEKFVEISHTQSLHALLYCQLKDTLAWETWPDEVTDSLKQESKRLAAMDLMRQQELKLVLKALAENNVAPLILKGVALAYSHYPAPFLRTRNDTDLLIWDADKQATARILGDMGYQKSQGVSGELISYESSYIKPDSLGVSHVLDVHWRLNNSQLFAQALTFGELKEEAVHITPWERTPIRSRWYILWYLPACIVRPT